MAKNRSTRRAIQEIPKNAILETMKAQVQELDRRMNDDLTLNLANWVGEALQTGEDQGKTQWWNDKLCSIEFLQSCAHTAINAGDFIGAATFCGMIEYRNRAR